MIAPNSEAADLVDPLAAKIAALPLVTPCFLVPTIQLQDD
jgi:hypothetical protein